ncbi:hypothetical protein C0989_012069 [Termitomyces sp. Mn162]|nr:hypothetical protein C0989_012069 [Termitomyces sp. Mn162]
MAPPTQPSKTDLLPPVVAKTEAVKMCKTNNTAPMVMQIKVSLQYGGDLLAKDDGKWMPWLKFMKLELTMSGLYEYVFDPPEIPHCVHEP